MNQLVREDNYLLDKTYIFTYDTAGNILAKDTYNCVLTNNACCPNSTVEYTYASTGWKDQLVSFGDETITYDALGNPTIYRSHNLTWGKLRHLNSFDNNTFTYNINGIRISKNSVIYTLDGTKILSETRPTGTIEYLYGFDEVIGFIYNGITYHYEKNTLNDVTAIVDGNGNIKAKYLYDAWGNHTITLDIDGIGTLNPFRYKTYYYDVETGLYYLQNRYYDPEVGRFLNADTHVNANGTILGFNMFAYCNNNPVMGYDPTGEVDWGSLFMGGLELGIGSMLLLAVGIAAATVCAPVGLVAMAGFAALAIGGTAFVALGASDVQEAFTGDNYLKEADSYEYVQNIAIGATSIGVALNPTANMSVCFEAGTLVATEKGDVPIEDIRVGSLVYAHNPDTGKTALKKVVQLFRNETKEWVHVTANGEEITCTSTHPFYVPEKGWTSAIDLRAGDNLVMLNGEYVVIEQVWYEFLEKTETTYNCEVEDFHTYYVTQSAILVHNRCRSKNKLKPNPNAQGDHSTFKYGKTGKIEHYATYKYNPKNPSNYDEVLRYDGVGRPHGGVPTPHIKTGKIVRPAERWEIPK